MYDPFHNLYIMQRYAQLHTYCDTTDGLLVGSHLSQIDFHLDDLCELSYYGFALDDNTINTVPVVL